MCECNREKHTSSIMIRKTVENVDWDREKKVSEIDTEREREREKKREEREIGKMKIVKELGKRRVGINDT